MVLRQPDMKLTHGSDQWLVATHSSTPVAGAPSRKAHHLVLVSRPDRFATAFPHFDGIQISDFLRHRVAIRSIIPCRIALCVSAGHERPS
jgi:hypothetical protein